MARPIITQFEDYRDYLVALFEHAKETKSFLSYQYLATKLSLSKSFLKFLFTKTRHITIDRVTKLCAFFELDSFEKQYFILLYMKTTTEDHDLQKYFGIVLSSLGHRYDSNTFTEPTLEDLKEESLFLTWLPIVIHSMADLKNFEATPEWIKKHLFDPDVSLLDIEYHLNKLIENGSIFSTDGIWKSAKLVTSYIKAFDHTHLSLYRIGQLRALASNKQGHLYTPSRYAMLAASVDMQSLQELIELRQNFMTKAHEIIMRQVDPTHVVFLSDNLFTIASSED